MYLFIYKTTHTNGKYYIGRHQTDNIDDGYLGLGSGDWVKSIKDKSSLTREIIVEATSIEELKTLEEYHIGLHFGKPGCMNYKRGSDGWTSEDIRKQVESGTHNFLGGEIQKRTNKKRVENGTHPFLGPESNRKRIEAGTHNFLDTEFRRQVQRKRVADGTHHLLGGHLHRKLVENGTHPLLGGEIQRKQLEDGKHPSQVKWTCPHCGKSGKCSGMFTRFHGDNCKSLN